MSLFGQTVNPGGKTGLFGPITLARRCIDCHTLRELAADAADTAEEPNFVEANTGCDTPAIIRVVRAGAKTMSCAINREGN